MLRLYHGSYCSRYVGHCASASELRAHFESLVVDTDIAQWGAVAITLLLFYYAAFGYVLFSELLTATAS
jgi:hypothetical protein